ncbi:MAG: 1-(5-phosphoribosyl)-5-[(5-phosphoribosylamino)methylideneamino] imidazole-4-carboxamide isomerase, partial [Nitrososphaerota archaeon]
MLVIPSIDLMDGKVVRLLRGDPRQARFYDDIGDPVTIAKTWESMGAQLIHVVDLDAALGRGDNVRIMKEIISAVKIPIQVGGGIRSIERARQLISLGAGRIVIGSLAFKDVNALEALLDEVGPERIVVALDHSMGIVMIDGWRENTGMRLREAAKMFIDMGVSFLLITSIQKD